jgi:hypothetical protein
MSNAVLEVLGPSVQPTAIDANTRVVVGHRGAREPFTVMPFDGQKWRIPSGKEFLMPYGVALTLRQRMVVPGSRDVHSGKGGTPLKQKSYLYIRPLTEDGRKVPQADREEDCRPFTPAELARYGEASEALARAKGEVRQVSVTEVRASMLAQSGVDLEEAAQAPVDPAVLAPIPADQNANVQEARAAEGAAGRGGRRR